MTAWFYSLELHSIDWLEYLKVDEVIDCFSIFCLTFCLSIDWKKFIESNGHEFYFIFLCVDNIIMFFLYRRPI